MQTYPQPTTAVVHTLYPVLVHTWLQTRDVDQRTVSQQLHWFVSLTRQVMYLTRRILTARGHQIYTHAIVIHRTLAPFDSALPAGIALRSFHSTK